MFIQVPVLAARFFLVFLSIFLCLAAKLSSSLPRLPNDEVEALKEIGTRMGRKDWNFSVDPCSGESGWIIPNQPSKYFDNNVTCNCSFSNNLCHVVSISMKGQNLSGTVPPEMAKLPYLQQIVLTRNYLNGTIPPEWASLPLVIMYVLSLMGNRITGSIPREFGNISTLQILSLENNWLSGPIPPELGNLSSIQRLYLNSNNFTEELPETLSRLTTLLEFQVVDNLLTGKIPEFIEGWTNLDTLVIQGSGLDGPIPAGIALLTNLTDLRISDLNGPNSTIPPFHNMKKLRNLNCKLIGHLPGPLGTTNLKILDLSFNKLSGPIPSSFDELKLTQKIYLTGNLLTGPVPDWMLNEGMNIDLSYNNFTFQSSRESSCQPHKVNLFASFSKNISSGIVSCLNTSVCPTNMSSFHVNCGGRRVDGNTVYEADRESGDASKFIRSGTNWAFSNTGQFLDDSIEEDNYIYTSNSSLSMINSNLYRDARLSPLSLTYYGFCLINGNYTVRLHFAEIIFTNDKTYSSNGRRIFDIFIQGVLVQKDFNIVDEAGGVGKEIVKVYNVSVTSTTMDIRFYWAGKGTTAIPHRGVYGPLISAISVDHNFILPIDIGAQTKGKGVSVGTIVGAVAGGAIGIFLILGILCWTGILCHKKRDLNIGSFTLRQIKSATNNFDAANIIGAGGFGSVYKGFLSDGTIVAVKQLSSKSKQGNREFVNEIGMISALQHPHLVKLHGCCTEGNQLLLVYEYLENNSLARALFGPEEYQLQLDWPTRYNICIGVARGLAYLHEESRIKVVHRDIKTSNVLLDKNLSPKISDFGLAKLDEEENTHISTRIAGTYGYMAPEYALRGYLTDKADVYSYGVVALEIVSGMANIVDRSKQNRFILLDKALALKENGNLMELVDPRLGKEYNEEEVMVMINVALFCTNILPEDRPMMSSVVSMLEGRNIIQEFVLDRTLSSLSTKMYPQFSLATSTSDSQVQSMSNEGSWVPSPTSGVDLYSVNHNEYLEDKDSGVASSLLK